MMWKNAALQHEFFSNVFMVREVFSFFIFGFWIQKFRY